MGIPSNYKPIMLPYLEYIGDSQEHHRKDITNALAAKPFAVTPEQWAQVRKSGHPVFAHHCDWAQYHLKQAGLIELPRRGYSKITDRGLSVLRGLNHNKEEIESVFLESKSKFYNYINARWPIEGEEDDDQTLEESIEDMDDDDQTPEVSIEDMDDDDQTPEESIEEKYQKIQKDLAAELLRQIKNNTPSFFEKLVVDLLIAMGYGGSWEDAGEVTGGPGDGGIDGIINQDKLGLDVVGIQAKLRTTENNVGPSVINEFVGALRLKGLSKGVIITTAGFSSNARASAEGSDNPKIVLIDGEQLAQLMIDHDVGVSTVETYEIKRVDSDYFAENTE